MSTNVSIPLTDGSRLRAAWAAPESGEPAGNRPGVIVLHEIFGLAPEMRAVVDRLAEHGWVAVAPDLFSHGNRLSCLVRAIWEGSRGQPGRVATDIEATRRWLAARQGVDAERLGVLGFCMGGGFALTYGASAPAGVRSVSVNYGDIPRHEEALQTVCPVVASYGARDRIFGRQGRRLAGQLERLGVVHDVKLYADAGHSFMTDGRHPVARFIALPMHPGYVPHAADDAWQRTLAFFDRQFEMHERRDSRAPPS